MSSGSDVVGGNRPSSRPSSLPSKAPRAKRLSGVLLEGRYFIGSRIGNGAMGEVYRAEQISLGRPVAIKVLSREAAHVPELSRRFEREARALSRLQHPGIAGILDFGFYEGAPYLVTDLVDGETLEERLLDRGVMPPDEAAQLLVALLDALEHAHKAGVIHRDLKPSNVILTGASRARITDFGVARLLSGLDSGAGARSSAFAPTLTRSGLLLGTPAYASPEQALGRPLDGRSDLYSLGVIAYRMLAGRLPFAADSAAEVLALQVNKKADPLMEAAEGLPPAAAELAGAIEKMLSKAARDRFPSAAHAAAAIRTAAAALALPDASEAAELLASTASMRALEMVAARPSWASRDFADSERPSSAPAARGPNGTVLLGLPRLSEPPPARSEPPPVRSEPPPVRGEPPPVRGEPPPVRGEANDTVVDPVPAFAVAAQRRPSWTARSLESLVEQEAPERRETERFALPPPPAEHAPMIRASWPAPALSELASHESTPDAEPIPPEPESSAMPSEPPRPPVTTPIEHAHAPRPDPTRARKKAAAPLARRVLDVAATLPDPERVDWSVHLAAIRRAGRAVRGHLQRAGTGIGLVATAVQQAVQAITQR